MISKLVFACNIRYFCSRHPGYLCGLRSSGSVECDRNAYHQETLDDNNLEGGGAARDIAEQEPKYSMRTVLQLITKSFCFLSLRG
jgi:hypothetical protein